MDFNSDRQAQENRRIFSVTRLSPNLRSDAQVPIAAPSPGPTCMEAHRGRDRKVNGHDGRRWMYGRHRTVEFGVRGRMLGEACLPTLSVF